MSDSLQFIPLTEVVGRLGCSVKALYRYPHSVGSPTISRFGGKSGVWSDDLGRFLTAARHRKLPLLWLSELWWKRGMACAGMFAAVEDGDEDRISACTREIERLDEQIQKVEAFHAGASVWC
jgi:hypothetical protein